MIGTITLDKAAATASESAPRISETGAYVGRIVQAEQYDTRAGATMARFYFQAEDGASAWLTMCLLKTDGTEPFTMNIFHSILRCAVVSAVTATPGKVRTMSGQTADGYRMRELEGKRVGLLLQAEPREYQAQDGSIKIATDMTIRRAFDAETGRTAKELSTDAPAQRIQADLKYYREHPKEVRRLEGASQSASTAAAAPSAAYAAPADDCPF